MKVQNIEDETSLKQQKSYEFNSSNLDANNNIDFKSISTNKIIQEINSSSNSLNKEFKNVCLIFDF